MMRCNINRIDENGFEYPIYIPDYELNKRGGIAGGDTEVVIVIRYNELSPSVGGGISFDIPDWTTVSATTKENEIAIGDYINQYKAELIEESNVRELYNIM